MMSNKKIFYGWAIVALAVFAVTVTNGLSIGGIPIFYRSFIKEFGWDRTTIAFAGSVLLFARGLAGPLTGPLYDKYGPKRFMVAGAIIIGITLVWAARINAPVHLYAAQLMFAVGLTFAGLGPGTYIVSNWFSRMRGRALGIVATGTSLGGIIFSPLSTKLIQNYGWRNAMLIYCVFSFLVFVPLMYFLVKNRPNEIGAETDGDDAPAANAEKKAVTGATLAEALASPAYWMLLVGSSLCYAIIFAITQQFILHLQSTEVGLSPEKAAAAYSVLFTFSFSGKAFFGWVSDRMPKRLVNLLCCAMMLLGTLVLLRINASTTWVFCALFGLGYGGITVTTKLVLTELFGLRSLGKLLGIMMGAETLAGAAGNLLAGKSFDTTGSYLMAFQVMAGCALAAVLLMALLRRKSVTTEQAEPATVAA